MKNMKYRIAGFIILLLTISEWDEEMINNMKLLDEINERLPYKSFVRGVE